MTSIFRRNSLYMDREFRETPRFLLTSQLVPSNNEVYNGVFKRGNKLSGCKHF